MRNSETFTISKTTRGKVPSLPFLEVKEKILGKKYNLGLVFIGQTRSRTLNKKYRNKNKPANVLTFPLDKNEGEIFITLDEVKKDAPQFGKSYKVFLAQIFIHGLLHLKEFKHDSTMELEEDKWLRKFNLL